MPPDLVPIQLEAEDWPYLSSTITVGTTATLGYVQDGVGTSAYMTNEIDSLKETVAILVREMNEMKALLTRAATRSNEPEHRKLQAG